MGLISASSTWKALVNTIEHLIFTIEEVFNTKRQELVSPAKRNEQNHEPREFFLFEWRYEIVMD